MHKELASALANVGQAGETRSSISASKITEAELQDVRLAVGAVLIASASDGNDDGCGRLLMESGKYSTEKPNPWWYVPVVPGHIWWC